MKHNPKYFFTVENSISRDRGNSFHYVRVMGSEGSYCLRCMFLCSVLFCFVFPFFHYDKCHSMNSTMVTWNLDRLNTGAASVMKGPSKGTSKDDWKAPTFIPWGSQKCV